MTLTRTERRKPYHELKRLGRTQKYETQMYPGQLNKWSRFQV